METATSQILEAPDVETSSNQYAARFDGKVGRYFLSVQERIFMRAMERFPGSRVLDVGGGHGQLAIPLAKAGFEITVLGSEKRCVDRLERVLPPESYSFQVGDLLSLPFDDKSFDVVIAFRMLSHVRRWREFLGQLCRVARRRIILDYADLRSVNVMSDRLFSLKNVMEGHARPFRCFHSRQITSTMSDHGYRVSGMHRQFFLPMALHRWVGMWPFTIATERAARTVGLTRYFGSPVILVADAHHPLGLVKHP